MGSGEESRLSGVGGHDCMPAAILTEYHPFQKLLQEPSPLLGGGVSDGCSRGKSLSTDSRLRPAKAYMRTWLLQTVSIWIVLLL